MKMEQISDIYEIKLLFQAIIPIMNELMWKLDSTQILVNIRIDGIYTDHIVITAEWEWLISNPFQMGNNASGMMRAVIAAERIGIMPEHEA